MKRSKTRSLILCAMFVALIAVGAFIRIPTPMVPITLQYLFTMLAGLFLGGKLGCLSVCIYIALGLLGLPVFTQGGGPGYIFQPSFGYIIGFAAGALATGTVAGKSPRPGFPRLLAANFIGLGTFYLGTPIGLLPLLFYCILMTLPWDILLCVAGAGLGKRLIPILRSERI